MNLGKRVEGLESIRTGPKNGGQSAELRAYFHALENHQLELEELPPIHRIENDPDPELDAYFADLDLQIERRERLLRERKPR